MTYRLTRSFFGLLGIVTGIMLVRAVTSMIHIPVTRPVGLTVAALVALGVGGTFFAVIGWAVDLLSEGIEKVEAMVHRMTLQELAFAAAGLTVGLVVANLVSIPLIRIPVIGVVISVIANVLFGACGTVIARSKRHDGWHARSGGKVLDTSALIDGRVQDVLRSHFIEGMLFVPSYVVEELRRLAEQHDPMLKARGRRGLDVLAAMQKSHPQQVRMIHEALPSGEEVDAALIRTARRIGAGLMTHDINIEKAAAVQGIQVASLHVLAGSMKPMVLPGEEMTLKVVREGKEAGQGIGYLEDGTLIIVEGGKKMVGQDATVVVTNALQTSTGRMIFTRMK